MSLFSVLAEVAAANKTLDGVLLAPGMHAVVSQCESTDNGHSLVIIRPWWRNSGG